MLIIRVFSYIFRVETRKNKYIPISDAQKKMLELDLLGVKDVCMFGASGAGKTIALIISSLGIYIDKKGNRKFLVNRPEYRCLVLRREAVLLERAGLLSTAQTWYRNYFPTVKYNKVNKTFTFPSGAQITFAGCERDEDKEKFKGYSELHCVCFEELTQFSESIFNFITSRMRTKTDIPLRIRSTTNPGDLYEDWVRERYKYWITKCVVPLEREMQCTSGEVIYRQYDRLSNKVIVSNKEFEGSESISGVETFINDVKKDNDVLMSNALGNGVLISQLVEGIWGLKDASGTFFKEHYFSVVDEVPTPKVTCRYWDKACSGQKGDYLCGMKVSHFKKGTESFYVIEDTILVKPEPSEVFNIIKKAAKEDGEHVTCILEKEPGSSGKELSYIYKSDLERDRVRVLIDEKRVSKIDRASFIAPLAKSKHIMYIQKSEMNEVLKQLVSFPSKNINDDAVDCLSGAIFYLSEKLPQPSTFGKRTYNNDIYNLFMKGQFDDGRAI